MSASALYIGTVAHKRLRPKAHKLRYRVFSLLLDLDELPGLKLRWLGVNRPGLLSFPWITNRKRSNSRPPKSNCA